MKILRSLKELKSEGFLKMSNEIKNFLNANYGPVKYKNKLNILDILELSDSDFQDFIKIYKSKEKEIGVSINKGQFYVKRLKNIRRYLLIFATLYGVIMLAVLPFMFVFYPKNWLTYELIIIVPWLLSLIYIIFPTWRIYKFNKRLSIKYNNKEYIPPPKLDILQIEWIQNESTYDFPTHVKNVINYVMSLPDTVKCSVCGGSGEVLVARDVPDPNCTPGSWETYVFGGIDMDGKAIWYKECYTTEWVPAKCKHCGGLGYIYIQETKEKIKAHGYELIYDFNNFLNKYPNLKDEIQSLNSKLQIYVSRLKFIKDTFYS